MKTWRYGLAIGLLAGLGACSNMMGGGSGQTSHAVATQPAIAPDTIRQVQAHLRDDGYYKQGNVDGVWGPGTESAVRSFQADHRLTSNGQLDVPTLQALNLTNAPTTTTNGAVTNNVPVTNDGQPTQPVRTAPPVTDPTVGPANR